MAIVFGKPRTHVRWLLLWSLQPLPELERTMVFSARSGASSLAEMRPGEDRYGQGRRSPEVDRKRGTFGRSMRSAHDVRSGQRQVDTHGGALALDACQFDGAAVGGHEAAGDRQPESRAAGSA